jgi:hypothetical protein
MTARAALLALAVALLALPASAAAEETPFVDWSSWLPPTPGTFAPSSEDDCRAGRLSCVDKVIRSMTKRFDAHAESCDHDAMFALTYLRTTEEYRRATTTPGFFSDPSFVNHEDAVFARYYFDAYADWHDGRRSEVPEAWGVALDAADRKSVSGSGNMLLGINAHINRDLPYVLAGIGLVKPDGSSRKPDHDRVNEFLNRVSETLLPELARRFDPTVDDRNLPGWLDDMLTFQSFPAMREEAWRNAERLVNAKTALERALVEDSIEKAATNTAHAIRTATAYPPLSGGSASRDAYCAQHHLDP